MYHNHWLHKVGSLLVVAGLVLTSSGSIWAQAEQVDADPAGAEHTGSDSSFWAESDTEEGESKPEQDVVMPADDKDAAAVGNQDRIYLPAMLASGSDGEVNAASTLTILNEGFEGVWPAGLWKVKDYNGTLGGSLTWDDVSFRPQSGGWSAHPADSNTSPNNLFSVMEYGPFSLSGDVADFSFAYWLKSESKRDFFAWSYSCNNGVNWVEKSTSGSSNGWKQASLSLNECLGKPQVLIRFTFTSDTSNLCFPVGCGYEGVYVDNVKIQSTFVN